MSRVLSLVLLEEGICYDQYILLTKLLAFYLLHFLSKSKIFHFPGYLLTSYFCIQIGYHEKGHLCVCVLVLEGVVGLHRTTQLQFIHNYSVGIILDYCDIEWFALEMNRDHSVILEIASKYCISDSFVDHDGYSVSSEGFLE